MLAKVATNSVRYLTVILTAANLTTLQRCARRAKLESQYQVLRWQPKSLFDVLLRQSVYALSQGKDKAVVTSEATARFLEIAANPGLDTLRDPYTIAHDFAAILSTVIEAVSRMTLLSVKHGPVISLTPELQWRCTAFRDESGLLHRWTSVDQWDADAVTRELHSWHVFGDIAAARVPMQLHVVEIGRQRDGHQHTPWCKAWRHPVIAGHFRFRQKGGEPLSGDWKPVWFQDGKNQPDKWVDLMQEDRLDLIRHIDVKQPKEEHIEDFHRQVTAEATRLQALPDWREIPLFRPACDAPPCPWQAACYSSGRPDVLSLGGYDIIQK